jgi:hypothetical protein
MTAVKLLLFPLTIVVALLGPRYELWCLDEYANDAKDALSYPAISLIVESEMVPNACICLPCEIGASLDDDDSDD